MSPAKKQKKPGKAVKVAGRSTGFTDDEKAAMKERARELKAARGGKSDGDSEVRAKIAAMAEPDRRMAGRIHEIIRTTAPDLVPRLWYGMPAYTRNGKVLCFFQSARKFNTRYASLGFTDVAHLDDGAVWPVAFALRDIGAAEEARIVALVRQAVG